MAFDSKIENVRSIMLNLDMECYVDMVEGRGIRLTSVDSFTKKNEKIREGLQSDFFGTDFGDENAYAERYACKCRKYVGKMYEGKICECCNTPVEYSDTDLSKTGWIILDKYHVISPIYAAKLSDALGTSDGEKVLDKILKIKRPDDDDVNENPIIAFTDKELVELKKHPFMYKGEIWLKDHLEEVLDYYIAKKPAKKKLLQQIKNNISDVWTKCIPVYSAALRTELPGVKGNKLFKIRINTYYQSIIRIVNFINEYKANDLDNNEEIVINKQLAAIQAEIADVFNETCKELTGKKGIIISKVMGGRMNFSGRSIIVPSSGVLRSNEVELGYITFMELFRYEIVNLYSKVQNCTVSEASNEWKKALNHFNPIMYNIMKYMVTDEECKKHIRVLISRNPCEMQLSRCRE